MWGDNSAGGLGDGTKITRSSPVQVGTDQDWVKVSCGNVTTIALKKDGTAWTFGNGTYGKLGHGNITSYSSPVQLGVRTDWINGNGLYQGMAGMTGDGYVWTWGSGEVGLLGNGTTNTAASSPIQIGDNTWAVDSHAMGNSYKNQFVRNTSGEVFGWGYGGAGALGNNTSVNASSPTIIVGGNTDWYIACAGGNKEHNFGITSSGAMKSWGSGSSGRTAHNNTIYLSSPVAVSGTWDWAACGENMTFMIK
jgi:alpha-tubulin suppressor-like RCC1 family protein